jgi:hypothetical protein
VTALNAHPETADIPILVVTAKQVTGDDRARPHGSVATILEKGDIGRNRFIGEVRRAMAGTHGGGSLRWRRS